MASRHNYPIYCAHCGKYLGTTKHKHKAEKPYHCAGHQPNKAAEPVEDKMVRPDEDKDWTATDSAVELAAEYGIDLATVTGSGADGRILKGDVEAAIAVLLAEDEEE
jgi:pyruvate/2-oxoglutarate dehydrogenase complex dihydrolipoamide acyltransferase (E2) component